MNERFVSEVTYNVLMGTLNPTHSLAHSLLCPSGCFFSVIGLLKE